jgi:hypothetical protein
MRSGFGRALTPARRQCLGQVALLLLEITTAIRRSDGVHDNGRRLVIQFVEERSLVGEPWHPRFHPSEVIAVGQSVPHRAVPRIGLQELAGSPDDRTGRGPELSGREDLDLFHRIGRALVANTEGADVLDLVPPEVDPDRFIGLGRVHIDDPASDREFTSRFDSIGALIAEVRESAGEFGDLELDPTRKDDRFAGRRAQSLDRSSNTRNDDRPASPVNESVPRFGSPRHRGCVR